jgi:hypothetical protein
VGLVIMGIVDILMIISIGSFSCSQVCADSRRFFLDADEEAGGAKGRSQPVMAL